VRDAIVFNGVIDQAAEKSNIAAGANLHIHVSVGCRPREPRIHHNGLRVAVYLGFNRPLESARMVFRWIATMINIMSVFLMSIQPLVIAPRPNVAPNWRP